MENCWLIKQALDHGTINKHKSVLVAIFERNSDGSIPIKNNVPKVHTILLYSQENKGVAQIVVIDPSNSDFSKHLASNDGIIFGYEKLTQISTSPTLLKIYASPEGKETEV